MTEPARATWIAPERAARLVVIGSANMDLVVRTPRLPQGGETILGGPFETFAGGKGANQAVAAARMGAEVRMIGCVGRDAYGDALIQTLTNNGVETSLMARAPQGTPTGVAIISVDDLGENTIIVAPGANASYIADELSSTGPSDAIREAHAVLMQQEVPPGVVERAARIAREGDGLIIFNAAPARALSADLMALLDVLIVNEHEAAILAEGDESTAGDRDHEELARKLHRAGPAIAIITLGSAGCVACDAGRIIRQGSYRVTGVVDTTGAGDAFCGAFAADFAVTRNLAESLRVASAAAALSVLRHGAIASLPARQEVIEFMKVAAAPV